MSVLRVFNTILISLWCLTASAQVGGTFETGNKPVNPAGELETGINPTVGIFFGSNNFPMLIFNFGTVDYVESIDAMTGNMTEMSIQFSDTSPIVPLTNDTMTFQLIVAEDGSLISGVPGNDMELTGDVDVDGDGKIDFSGVLLTGEVISFGSMDGMGGTLDMFTFSFELTGGSLFDAFGGGTVMMSISANISNFSGGFGTDLKLYISEGYLIGKPGPLCTGAIGNYVWLDINGDGIQNDGETGINGVTVNLTDANGNVTSVETFTGGFGGGQPGFYQFTGLCAGDYTVTVDLSTLPPGVDPTLIGAPGSNAFNDSNDPNGTVVNLPNDNSTNQTIDFGFVTPLASLGDFVWDDVNMNGIQDPGDVGIEGVIVNLYDCSGVFIDMTMTDSTGFYEFIDLLAGCYQVEFILPNGFVFSPQFAGATNLDSNADPLTGLSDPVTLSPGENDPTIDAGMYQPMTSSLGDFVWDDVNMNGVQDPGELGIPSVFVTLLDCDGNILDSTMTGSDGRYEFNDLAAGCYKIMFTLPDGYTFSPPNVGTPDLDSNADPSNGMSELIDLGINEDNPTIDAGMYLPMDSAIGDFFWLDANGDGIQDPTEVGIPNVQVELFDCSGNSVGTTMTNADGFYLFDGLDAGCYVVNFTPPSECILTSMNSGNDPALDSNADPLTGQTDQIDLASGDVDLTIDAGCYYKAGLGDFLWNDENQNGIQDAGEPGIPGQLIELLDMNMNPTGMTTVTGNDGEYIFDDLAPGKYFVQFSAPAGFVYTAQTVGGDETVDSNVNGTGKSDIVMLASGEFNPTIDAGVFLPQEPTIDLEKLTNGFDADDPTGPYIETGGVVTWTYVITNTGNVTLSNIMLTDTVLGPISCPFSSLLPGQNSTCNATGIAIAGQYMNGSMVTGISPDGTEVEDDDPSHYFGSNPSIDIEKSTNGEDADDPTGPLVPVGSTVTWNYVVVNTGNVVLTDIVVTDSDPTVMVSCPFTVLQPIGAGISTMTCVATGTAQLGQYANDSDVVGTPPVGDPVTDEDPSHYFGIEADISIEKLTNGIDADDPNSGDAPPIAPGDVVIWSYIVTNEGNVTLNNIVVTDDQGVDVTCPMTVLAPTEVMTCTGEGVAQDLSMVDVPNIVPGVCGDTPNSNLYENIGTVVGTTPNGISVTDDDASHYCNALECLVGLEATCLIPMPPAGDYDCDKPIDTLVFIWDGNIDVRIKAYKGSVGSTLLADIDDISPGQEVSVSGFAGSPNDVYFEIFEANTNNKIGESNFHLSCSDDEMDGPEDCGTSQGNGKSNDNDLINDWLLEGIVDEGGVLDCTQDTGPGNDSCEFLPFPASCETIEHIDTLTLNYTGGSCADSQNSQGSGFDCEGTLDGSLPALVTLDDGQTFTVDPGESFITSDGKLTLSNAGGTMDLDIHTSCSQPLDIGDIYGATTLQQINNMGSGTDVIYGYTVTNTGTTDLVSLSAIDVPLGPVPGLPDFLAAGDSVTVFNQGFVDMTTVSMVTVNATDANGAVCSAEDTTTVTILEPPPCNIVGEGQIDIDNDKVKWDLSNLGASSATLENITLTWPEDVHGDLIEIKLDGDKIFDTNTSGGSVTLGPSDWIGDPSKRKIDAGDTVTLELKFDENNDVYGADAYSITVDFAEGCSVDFVFTGPPFECDKPIEELVMIWNGSQEPISVKAWKGDVGSELLLEQSGVTAGTEVTVSGLTGSPNDVYWEIFSGGNKLGESNFHLSCSDDDMDGPDDCGKAQGNGKSNDSDLINDWILEGMTDEVSFFDCTM